MWPRDDGGSCQVVAMEAVQSVEFWRYFDGRANRMNVEPESAECES